jgi:CRISPR-associated DxTHG motif protein
MRVATILLFTLGTGRYEPTAYVHEGLAVETRFAAQALRQFHDARFPDTPIDRAVVLVTEGARRENWVDHEGRLGLETLWRSEPCPLAKRDMPDPEGEAQFWDLFEALAAEVGDGDRVLLDITHGFRTMPLVAMLAVAYLRAVRRDVEVVMIGYGQYVPGVSPTPYLDLAPFVSLLDWTQAVQQLRLHGDAERLAALLKARQGAAYKASREQGWAVPRLKSVATALERLALGIQTLRYEEFTGAARTLDDALGQLGEADRHAARPFMEVADALRAEVSPLAARGDGHPLVDLAGHWRTLEWLWARKLYFPWLTLLNESLIAYVAAASGLDDLAEGDERKLREVHHYASVILGGARPKDGGDPGERDVQPWARRGSAFSQEVLAAQDQLHWRHRWRAAPGFEGVSALSAEVGFVRNALMHAGFSVNEVASDSAGLVRQLEDFRARASKLPIWGAQAVAAGV